MDGNTGGAWVKMPKALLADMTLTPAAKLVLAFLADSEAGNGHTWHGLRSIARNVGVSRPTAQRAVRTLVGLGRVIARSRPGQTADYTVINLIPPQDQNDTTTDLTLRSPPSQIETTPVSDCDPHISQTKEPDQESQTNHNHNGRGGDVLSWLAGHGIRQPTAGWIAKHPEVSVDLLRAAASTGLTDGLLVNEINRRLDVAPAERKAEADRAAREAERQQAEEEQRRETERRIQEARDKLSRASVEERRAAAMYIDDWRERMHAMQWAAVDSTDVPGEIAINLARWIKQ